MDFYIVDVDGKFYLVRYILIFVGGRFYIFDIFGSEYVIDFDVVFDLFEGFKKIVIIGGGYIVVEFVGIFNGLGSDVYVFIR